MTGQRVITPKGELKKARQVCAMREQINERIGIREIAGRLTGQPEGRRYMAMLWFYCDESLDHPQHAPKTYCVAGFFGEEKTFSKLEDNIVGINERFGVKRFHASPLNARDEEYEGWDKHRQIQYSKRMLKAIQKRGFGLQLTAIGIDAEAYRNLVSDAGRERFGHPYLACFKTCLMMLGTYMRTLPDEYKFSVIFERNDLNAEIVKAFYLLKDLDAEVGSRMGTCTPGQWDENIALQAADLAAYESMRYQKSLMSKGAKRLALQTLFRVNGSMGFYFDKDVLKDMSLQLEASNIGPGGFFYTARQFYPEYVDGDEWNDVERKVAISDRTRQL